MNSPDSEVADPLAQVAPALAWAERALGRAPPSRWTPLPVEASHRRFYRGTFSAGAPASVILMTAPPELENNAQFLRLAGVFGEAGIGVPAVYARDLAPGWFVLEDLGVRHFADVYATADRDRALAGALDTLVALQAVLHPAVPPYTAARFRDELLLFTDWFAAGLLGLPRLPDWLDEVFGLLVDNTQAQPQCCVHRDFHSRNLLLRDDGRVGVVDFQDALIGPASYDLASLLRDCYHVFPEAAVRHWTAAYLDCARLPLDPAQFPRQLDLTAVQRQLKAVGIFARLWLRDGKRSHLPWIQPVLARLVELCGEYPELRPLPDWLAGLQPQAARALAVPS
jgi:aminoglycoside/choline kinase family phosphotransferase